jgi:hypothetical protein
LPGNRFFAVFFVVSIFRCGPAAHINCYFDNS